MSGVPVLYQIHAVVGMILIALVPYTRLIHSSPPRPSTCSGRTSSTGARTSGSWRGGGGDPCAGGADETPPARRGTAQASLALCVIVVPVRA
ncbi:respiratory nitrate reductase subunit gamma [Streptomyces albidoflavus]|uniref:respiratory nitrate reductase subunit gamma n=1 Tax=Streptomyces albidoflavus TaxID=1886 RepID=UPI0027B9A54C|nr:respiratory nitrate reductase subunit gamma [Streptomyces albidoflavus]